MRRVSCLYYSAHGDVRHLRLFFFSLEIQSYSAYLLKVYSTRLCYDVYWSSNCYKDIAVKMLYIVYLLERGIRR